MPRPTWPRPGSSSSRARPRTRGAARRPSLASSGRAPERWTTTRSEWWVRPSTFPPSVPANRSEERAEPPPRPRSSWSTSEGINHGWRGGRDAAGAASPRRRRPRVGRGLLRPRRRAADEEHVHAPHRRVRRSRSAGVHRERQLARRAHRRPCLARRRAYRSNRDRTRSPVHRRDVGPRLRRRCDLHRHRGRERGPCSAVPVRRLGPRCAARAAFGALEEGTLAVHRLHREAFHARGVEPGEVRFDFARVVAFARR